MTSAPPPAFRRLSYIPALDVLRAFAVTLVLLDHLWLVAPYWRFRKTFSGSGFLGVDLFFVLSGFLITSLLLQEQHDVGRIDFGRFYLRRALRLLPALVVMLAAYLVYASSKGWPPFGVAQQAYDNVRATLLYHMNWQALWHPLATTDLVALWSLAIEEQYYLIWPLVVAGLVGIHRHPRLVLPGLAIATVAVMAWRVIVFYRWGWPSAYLRTDTRVDGLLAGSLLASLYVRNLTPKQLPRWTPFAVLAVWSLLIANVKADQAFAYLVGIPVWVVTSAVMILYVVSRPPGRRGLLTRGVEKIGTVSYAIYLWQVPVILAVQRASFSGGQTEPQRMTTAVAGIVVAATLSWFLVERPATRLRKRLEARRPPAGDLPAVTAAGASGG